MSGPILKVDKVGKTFVQGVHQVEALADISFSVMAGECFAVVGESGSGKSTLANLILGIYPPTTGTISYAGEPLPAKRQLVHRRAIQLVQQNPLSALNPKRTIGASLRLALDVHGIGAPSERRDIVGGLLEEVGLPAEFASRAPAALSGGQRQRVSIARALACQSALLVLDEPTSALDVLVQARVLKLLEKLRRKHNLTYIFITHDLCVVRNIADRVAVFEKGRLIELAATETLFTRPQTPYTRALISAVPVVSEEEERLRQRLGEPQNAIG
ncbi:MAG: ABC transporter ATP-binding protein [Alphaproteobacteria bacterium]|nr:ABC transporter ATP-binding protein [Alphaproteobacteria bacterium]